MVYGVPLMEFVCIAGTVFRTIKDYFSVQHVFTDFSVIEKLCSYCAVLTECFNKILVNLKLCYTSVHGAYK